MTDNPNSRLGSYVTVSTVGEVVKAFVPAPLPPNPPVRLHELYGLIERASSALGRLDGIGAVLGMRAAILRANGNGATADDDG